MRKLAAALVFAVAIGSFFFGSGMLFLVPGDPGESYLKSLITWRFLPGIVPTAISAVLFAATAALWNSHPIRQRRLRRFRIVVGLGTGAVALFWICAAVIAGARHDF